VATKLAAILFIYLLILEKKNRNKKISATEKFNAKKTGMHKRTYSAHPCSWCSVGT
jgi:uncharacterized membrane protein